uniref:Arf-GAP with coiled-coil, ANK repeat and PH domain-containing protein n=1 Tax=Sphaeramia orbicularis TaxID=375764 RepID=A0A672Y5J0_9TELE
MNRGPLNMQSLLLKYSDWFVSVVTQVMKLCGKMVEAGQAYSAANQLFLTGLSELCTPHRKDSVISNCLDQFNQGLQEMVSFHTMLFDQTQRAISQQLSNLCTRFLPQLSETRREFVRIGEDLETAALKNAQGVSHLLLATRKCHQHFALDYCLQLNVFRTQQRIDVLNSVFSYVHAQFTFFHQGFDLLRDLEPTMKTMAAQLSQLSTECATRRKELENKHLLVQQRDASGEPLLSPCPHSADIIQGYLFKRSRRKTKTWKRFTCWFSIRDNQLMYRKSHKEEPAVLFQDLRLCAVKSLDHIDRRFCFELLSVQTCCALQADSEQLKQAWLGAVQGSIDLAYREKDEAPPTQPVVTLCPGHAAPAPPTHRAPALGVALSVPGNHWCCDCGEEEPRWASVNLGVTMCIECSGIHRSLGVHVSKVRSLTLDSWDSEQMKLLCILGNDVINRIYEARCSEEGHVKPQPDSPRAQKEAWIKQKYVEKSFTNRTGPHGSSSGAGPGGGGQREHKYRAGSHGADRRRRRGEEGVKGWEESGNSCSRCSHSAVIGLCHLQGSLLACEFLLQNGANVNHRDQRGQGALHTAATAGHTG